MWRIMARTSMAATGLPCSSQGMGWGSLGLSDYYTTRLPQLVSSHCMPIDSGRLMALPPLCCNQCLSLRLVWLPMPGS